MSFHLFFHETVSCFCSVLWEILELVGLHPVSPRWREAYRFGLLALHCWLSWHVWTQVSRYLYSRCDICSS
jgi:hypothetical protein